MTDYFQNVLRQALAKAFGDDHRLIRHFEDQAQAVEDASGAAGSAVEVTSRIKDAVVVLLSGNSEFTNERVLEDSDSVTTEVDGGTLKLNVKDVARTEAFDVKFVPIGDTELFLPLTGTLMTKEHPALDMTQLGNFGNDAAAGAGGVNVGELYRNGSVLMVRVV